MRSRVLTYIGLLTIAFIVLKLNECLDWPWWLVVSPVWISISLYILLVLFILIILKKF